MEPRPKKSIKKHSTSFVEVKRALLKKELDNSFRKGISAFRFGLIPRGPSDHLPLIVTAKVSNLLELTMASWNLLADIHLYNNFMNISGAQCLINVIQDAYPAGNIYYNSKDNKLFYFFAELAQYLYKNQWQGRIKITKELLESFIFTYNQSSNLARSRDPLVAEEKRKLVEQARSEIMTIFIKEMNLDISEVNKPNSNSHEFKLAIRHSLELIHHIENSEGALKWTNRFKLIENNKPLVKKIISTDFLCLQECTNPDDIRSLFQSANKAQAVLSYSIDKNTSDHCVLIYDDSKFDLVDAPINFALEGKKPCIFAKFKNRDSGEIFIVASIHHPGGKHNLLSTLLSEVEALRGMAHENIPFYILGDYNHTKDFFQNENTLTNFMMIYPEQGTMAGSDYGNVNNAIDAVVTNQSRESLSVDLLNALDISPPAPRLPFVVDFESREAIAYPGFFQRVGVQLAIVPNKEKQEEKEQEIEYIEERALQSLGVSLARRSSLIYL